MVVFWQFLPSNAPIMQHNIHYWWFFLSHGNRWTKYLANPKIRRLCLLMFASLVALDNFHMLLSTQLIYDLTPEWRGGSIFHPLLPIYVKTPFYCIETVANNSLNSRYLVVFDRLWANVSPTLNTAFSLTNVNAKWWITAFNSSAISRNFNLRSAKTSLWNFFRVFLDNWRILVTWAFSIICVCV